MTLGIGLVLIVLAVIGFVTSRRGKMASFLGRRRH
jgi:hypothetical protein